MKEEAEAAVESAKGVLQDLVVVISLVRTLTESFGSASDLYRKLKRKAKSSSHGSDDAAEGRAKRRRRHSISRRDSSSDSESDAHADRKRRSHLLSWKVTPKKDDYSDSEEELICTSSSQVAKAYDRGYQELGEGFARGDLVAQNQLQAQIIQLQRTLLSIHQDYMLSTYLTPSSSYSHLVRLIQTTRSTRTASIQALQMQYHRMLAAESSAVDPCPNIPGAFPIPPQRGSRNDSSTGRERSRSRNRGKCQSPRRGDGRVTILPFPHPSRSKSRAKDRCGSSDRIVDPGKISILPYPYPSRSKSGNRDRSKSPERVNMPGEVTILPFPNPSHALRPKPKPPANKLFCVYARDLQEHSKLPLTDNFKACGDNMCPFCHACISTRPGKAWEIIADSCKKGEPSSRRIFLVKNRFVVKCHREGSGFACVLCARFKDLDTVCRGIEALMDHLWKDHEAAELEKDDDIWEIDE